MSSSNLTQAKLPVKILGGNRITIPHELISAWNLIKGDTVWITIEKPEKEAQTN